jgi:hypothetical protein
VTLMARARVDGAVAAETIRLGLRAAGAQLFCARLERIRPTPATCEPATAPLVDAATLPIVQVDPGRDDVRLPRLATQGPLAPGAYGIVRIGERSELTLAGGEYHVRSLWVGNRGRLLCQAACLIRVGADVVLRDRVEVGAVPPLDARAVRIEVRGGRGRAAFRVYRGATLNANVYAPNGGIVLGMNGRYTGAFIGKTIFVYPRAQITGANAF